MAVAGDEDPRVLSAQFDLVQRELGRMQQQLGAIQDALQEAQAAGSTLDALTADTESLVPIGSGLHIRARLEGAPILVPVGAGYSTEADVASAKSHVAQRITQLTQAFTKASTEAERLARTAASLNDRLASLESADMV